VEGTTLSPAHAAALTHVHKWGCGWIQDCYTIGTWVDGNMSAPGVWTTDPTSPPGAQYERGVSYAAKDFWDSKNKRRINWAWAPLYTNSLTMPREVRYDPRIQKLSVRPLSEQEWLRNGSLAQSNQSGLAPEPLRLKATAQAEALVMFAMPSKPVALTVNLTTANGSNLLSFRVDYAPLGLASQGSYYSANVTGISTAQAPGSEAQVDPWAVFQDELRLVPDDSNMILRLFVDHTIAEAYWQDQIAMTLPFEPPAGEPLHLEVYASVANLASIETAQVWSVASIWVEPEAVLKASATRSKKI